MTDGQCGQPERTKEIANELKKNNRITLAASFFATKGKPEQSAALLRTICSDAQKYFRTVYDPETLRDFWTNSMYDGVRK